VYKQINRLALPAIIAGIAEPLIALADNAIIGHLGTTELGAVGLGTSFYLLIVWILAQTKTAISAIVSKHYGENRLNSLKNLIPLAILVNLGLGLFFLVVTWLFAKQIFTAYSASGELLGQTISYFKIRAFGFPLALITFGCFGIFRGMQNTMWAMKIAISGSVINLILNIILVYGIDGLIPAFGIKGAAYASVTAQCLMVSMAFWYLHHKTPFKVFGRIKNHPQLKNLLGLSSNLFVRTILLNIAYFLSNKLCTMYGTEVIAAHTIAMNIWLFSAFFIDGYANAGNAMSGMYLGKKQFGLLNELRKKLSYLALGTGSLLSLVYLLLYPYLVGWFTPDTDVHVVFKSIFWLIILSQPINAIAFIYDGIFKGLGEARFLRNVLFYATIFAFIPVIVMSHYNNWNITGVWLAFLVWMIIRALLPMLKFKKQFGSYKV
jgi:MATE family multidrug resistance protein